MITKFETYWREYGRLDDAITQNPELEDTLKLSALKSWSFLETIKNQELLEMEHNTKPCGCQ